jgi:hypothetical protein
MLHGGLDKKDEALETFMKEYKIKANQTSDDSVSLGSTAQSIAKLLF